MSAAAMHRACLVGLLCIVVGAASAQNVVNPVTPDQKSVRVVRTATPPVIDGNLDDAVWANAALIDDLHQTVPFEYAEPYEHTEIYILYDDDALYVAARLYDTDPEQITAQNMRQNDSIGQDDSFYVSVDPFNERRGGYFFGVNPMGVRQDGIYRNITEIFNNWDSIFRAAAGRFDEGWTAEIEIPFRSLSFDPTTDTWGINFTRGIPRKNERLAWSSRNRQFDPSVFGQAVGFEGLRQGVGLDVVTSAAATQRKDFGAAVTDTDFEPSLDVVYKITPQVNGSLTINTDFSATEVDDRQVNLTRFGLFFPEKRDFFLRESDIFEFGGIGGQRQSQIPGFQTLSQNGRPFFSRRIGLSADGQIVDLKYGGKISGRVGRWELGALSIRQDEYGPAADDTLSVVRARRGVLRESNIGVITTEGNPSGNVKNSLGGIDFLYRNTRLPGSRTFETDVWYQKSDTEGMENEDAAYGVSIRLPSSEGFRTTVQYKAYEENFNPALGFINRHGISDSYLNFGYLLRPGGGRLDNYLFNIDYQRIDFLDGGMQTEIYFVRPMQLTNRSGDSMALVVSESTEVVTQSFEISDGIIVPPGEYAVDTRGFTASTGNHRSLAASMRVVTYPTGGFYGGDRVDKWLQFTWRPSARFRTSLSYDYSEIDLPQGSFEVRLVRVGFDVSFSSTLSLVNLIQYDNVSEVAGINMRLHWIPQAGREVYLVVNHNVADPDRDNRFHSIFSDMTAKVNYTFRF